MMYPLGIIWTDRTITEIKERFAAKIAAKEPLVIRDEKTLSGRVHIGSLRGIVIHGLIAGALQEAGIPFRFLFELNDFDPMDGLSEEFASMKEYMGKPLFRVPSHEKGHTNYPMMFGDELKGVVDKLNFPIEWYTLKPLYEEGRFNDCIRDALENATTIRTIYKEVSGGEKPDDWFPLQVICEKCGKVGTTQVTTWDAKNETVTYACKKDLVEWAEGCGHKGTISPFDGRATLPWKVGWAAKWKVMQVNIEGCGKDHSAAGGSRTVAARISEEVFRYPNPFDIPYEFFNIAGKKMSASKGRGASAKAIADLLPPVLLKLLMIRIIPNRTIDFDPAGRTIPNLFDEYDRLADHYFKRHPNPDADFARTFRLTQLDPAKEPEDLWQMRFSLLSFILQMPHLDLLEEANKLKMTELTEAERTAIFDRAHYVKQWLDSFAPAEEKYTILESAPENLTLDSEQKAALQKLAKALADVPWEGPKIHERIHAVKEETGIAPKKLFEPIYWLFLGRNSGPQVGWFLSTFERKEVVGRLGGAGVSEPRA